jgi:thiol-disulfide isomerase/thioredoxin
VAKRARTKSKNGKKRRRPPPPPPSKFYGLGSLAVYILIIVVIIAIGAYAAYSLGGDDGPDVDENGGNGGNGNGNGSKAPTFAVTDINGGAVYLEAQRGKVVILDLFATWCQPCRDQMPELKEIDHAYSDSEVVILSIDIDTEETVQQVRDFKNEFQAGWTFAMDTFGVGPLYNVERIPTLALIDREGNLVWLHTGVTTAEELKARIDPLL